MDQQQRKNVSPIVRSIVLCTRLILLLALPKQKQTQSAESPDVSPTTNNSTEKYTDLSQLFKIISEIRPIGMMVYFGLVLVLVHQERISLNRRIRYCHCHWLASQSFCRLYPNHLVCEWKSVSIPNEFQSVYQKEE